MNRFVILTQQRTGSTFFRLWLQNHLQIRCHDEVFLRHYYAQDGFRFHCSRNELSRKLFEGKPRRLPTSLYNSVLKWECARFIKRLYDGSDISGPWTRMDNWHDYQPHNNEDIAAVGFKLMWNQVNDFPGLQKQICDPQVAVINLYRRNKLKIFISRELMQYRTAAHSETSVRELQLRVDCGRMIATIEQLEAEDRAITSFCTQHKKRCLRVSYEQIFGTDTDVEAVFRLIADFLSVENMIPELPALQKLTSDNLRSVITNFSEVEENLKSCHYGHFLD